MSKVVEYYCKTCDDTFFVSTNQRIIPTHCLCVKCGCQVWRRGIKEKDEKTDKK